MAEENKKTNNQDKRTEDDGFITQCLKLPFRIFQMLLISAFISSLVEVVGMATDFWDIKGIGHSQMMLTQELEYLQIALAKNIFTHFSGLTVQTLFDNTVGYVFEFFQLLGFFDGSTPNGIIGTYIGAVVNIFAVTFMRFFVFVFTLPLYFIFGYVGLMIGIVERDKRRAGGGRESGALFQFFKSSVVPSVALALFIYLAWPDSLNPTYVFFPSALLFATAAAYMTASYKKYA